MRNTNIVNKINWEMLFNLPLDTKLARKAAPRISEHNAANQKATAIHEALHICYAVKHQSPVLWAEIGTSVNSKNALRRSAAKGSICDYLDKGTMGSIESHFAAGLFEFLLDDDKENYAGKAEENCGVDSIRIYRDIHKNNVSLNFFSELSFVENILEKIYPHELGANWSVIKTVAKALLYYRTSEGYIPPNYLGQITAYVRNAWSQNQATQSQIFDFHSTIRELSPFVKKQNAIERKQFEKWMRENDLDTILEKNKKKQLKYNY